MQFPHPPDIALSLLRKHRSLKSVFGALDAIGGEQGLYLIRAEIGTEVWRLARVVHERSGRSGPIFHLRVADLEPSWPLADAPSPFTDHQPSIPLTLDRAIEHAHEGVLFIDDVGQLPEEARQHLLAWFGGRSVLASDRATQIPVNVLVIAVDRIPPRGSFEVGTCWSGPWSGIIGLPALRDRRDDIPALARWLLQERGMLRPHLMLEEPVMDILADQPWPGNLVELDLVLRFATFGRPDHLLTVPRIDRAMGDVNAQYGHLWLPRLRPGCGLRAAMEDLSIYKPIRGEEIVAGGTATRAKDLRVLEAPTASGRSGYRKPSRAELKAGAEVLRLASQGVRVTVAAVMEATGVSRSTCEAAIRRMERAEVVSSRELDGGGGLGTAREPEGSAAGAG